MPDPILSKEAVADLDAAYDYFASFSPTAADRFVDEFWDRAKLHVRFPKMGRLRDDLQSGMRSFVVNRYLAFYVVNGDTIEFVRIIHGSRDLSAIFTRPDAD